MKKGKIALIFLFLVTFSSILNAQGNGQGMGMQDMPENGVLSGTILDNAGNPVEYATVSLFSLRDDKLVTGGITDEKGYFKITKIKLGGYKVDIKFIGFDKKTIKSVYLFPKGRGKGEGIDQDLGQIILETSSIAIENVNVVADKLHVQYKIDKKIINVSQDVNAVGGTAVDVLENTPSVNVDIDGNVELRGSTNFTVLIDGKPTVLASDEALQQIPANLIENIEIITNPSAKFDPDGAAGIINVIMKKNQQRGVNGVVNVSIGTKEKYKADANFSYKVGKFNITAGFDYRNEKRFGTGSQDRITNYIDTTFYMNYAGDRDMNILGYGIKGGIDYYINDNNTLTISGQYGQREFSRNLSSFYQEWSNPANTEDFYIRNSDVGYSGNSYSINLNYSLKFKKPDRKLDALFYYSNWDGKRIDDQDKYITDLNANIIDSEPELRKSDLINPSSDYRYQFDYVTPFGEEGVIEAGYQGRYEQKTADYQYVNYDPVLNIWINDLDKMNKSDFYRNIQAVYGTISDKFWGFNYKIGLRMEYTDRLLDQYTSGDKYSVNRFDYFPSAYITREINKKQQIQMSYSRRVNRPDDRDLNPFPNYADPYNVRMGNPALEPEYVDSYELNFQNRFGKSFLAFETYYRRTNNLISNINILAEDNVLYRTLANLNHDNSIGAELSANLSFTNWWKLNGSATAYYYSIIGELDGENINNDSYNWNLRLDNTFSFKSNTRIQLTAFYTGPSITAQGTRDEFYFMNVAIRQDLLNKKMTITAQLRDVFNTMAHSTTTETEDFYTYSKFTREGQVFTLSLTYRINNYKDKSKNGRNGNGDSDVENMEMD
ncbi:MAG: TonB-dependent receptor [Bacteroidales bacterium]|nr:TonB-dependent receptor [Bacteroidales bacterium]